MIIKKHNQKMREKEKNKTPNKTGEDFVVQNIVEQSNENTEAVETTYEEKEEIKEIPQEPIREPEPEIDLFDIENIDFTQRQERRRGSRRRGYRRIDDRNLVSRAEEEAENIKKSAFEEGYRVGLEKAETDMQNFRNSLSEFMGAKKEVFEYIAPDIMEISLDIAKKVIKKEMESDPQIIMNTIIDVLKTISKNEPKISIRVRPQAVQFIKDMLPNVAYQYGIDAKVNIVADPSIEEGGCVFQTNNGIVDASIDTQLEIIKKTLEGM